MNPVCPQCQYPLPIGGVRCPECGLDVGWQATSARILPNARLLGAFYLFMAFVMVFVGVMHLDAMRTEARASGLGKLVGEANKAAMQFHIAWALEKQGGPPPQLAQMRADEKWEQLDDVLHGWPGAFRGSTTKELLRAGMSDFIFLGLSAATCVFLGNLCFRAHRKPVPEARVRLLPMVAAVLTCLFAFVLGVHALRITLG